MLKISDTLELPLDWAKLSTIVYGVPESGKSVLARVFAEELARHGIRFCIIDMKGDYYGLKSSANGREEGLPVVVLGGDHQDLALNIRNGRGLGAFVAGFAQSTILDLEHFEPDDYLPFLADFFSELYQKNRETLVLIADEFQDYAPLQLDGSKGGRRCLAAVRRIAAKGRKHALGRMFLTQRGAGTDTMVRELCEMLVAFRTPGTLDEDRIKKWLSSKTNKETIAAVVPQLAELPTGTALFASSLASMKQCTIHKVRLPRTFDSSATPQVGKPRVEPTRLAKPDLTALSKELEASFEAVENEDPEALRRRIRALEQQLAERVVAPPLPPPGATVLQVSSWLTALAQARDSIDGIVDAATAALKEHGTVPMGPALQELAGLGLVGETRPARRRPPGPVGRPSVPLEPAAAAVLARSSRRTKAAATPNGSSLPEGERAILIAIAQQKLGATRALITLVTGYKKSTRDAYLRRLAARGAVLSLPTGDLSVTPAGVALAGDFDKLPPRGPKLLAHWLTKLPEGEALVLRVVSQSPRIVTREEITQATSFKKSTRDAYLNRLAKRLLVVPQGGVVMLAPGLR